MPTGTAAVVVGVPPENMIVVAPGANAHLTMDSVQVREAVAAADVLLLQLEIPLATALTAARVARSAGATVVLNASPATGADLGELGGGATSSSSTNPRRPAGAGWCRTW